MQKEIQIHIGLHKTGSTSLQSILGSNRKSLLEQGYDFYRGSIIEDNHIELYLVTLRDDVETFSRQSARIQSDISYESVKSRVREFVDASSCDRLIFSCEGLSLLRTAPEVQALKSLFGKEIKYKILLVTREKNEFLASYRDHIFKKPGRKPSQDPNSALYVESDTWLLDFERLESVYQEEFGEVELLEYGDNIISEILDAMGIKLPGSAKNVFLNSRRSAQKSKTSRLKLMLKKSYATISRFFSK